MQTLGVKDPLWKVLEGVCERNFENFSIDCTSTVEEANSKFNNTLIQSAEETLSHIRPIKITLRAKLNTTGNIKWCRKGRENLLAR